MKILCPAEYPPDLAGLLYGLRREGHEVTVCDLGALPVQAKKPAWRRAWEESSPDLVFFYGFWRGLYTPDDLAPPPGWRRVPVVYWAADDPVFINGLSLPILDAIDRVYGGYLPHGRLAEIYSGAQIVLGLQFQNLSRTQTSCRVFETLACRALYLGPDTPGTRSLFTPGRHLILSGSAAETLALASYYLDRPAERERIAAAGQLEVYRKHTYDQRARELIAAVEQL